MKELLRNPLVPVKALPFQVNEKSGDIMARSSVCILPAAIVISAVEVVWIRQLRYAVSGNIISLEWDERFASLDIDLSVMDGYRSKGYLEIGIDSLLYLLQSEHASSYRGACLELGHCYIVISSELAE